MQRHRQLFSDRGGYLKVAFGEAVGWTLLDIKHAEDLAVELDGHGKLGFCARQERVADEEYHFIHIICNKRLAGIGNMSHDALSGKKAMPHVDQLGSDVTASLTKNRIVLFGFNQIYLNVVVMKTLLKQVNHLFHQNVGVQGGGKSLVDAVQGIQFLETVGGGLEQTGILDGDGGLRAQ